MQPTAELLGSIPGGVKVKTIDFANSNPALAGYIDGWEVINSQIVPAGEHTYLVFTLKTEVNIPDSPSGEIHSRP